MLQAGPRLALLDLMQQAGQEARQRLLVLLDLMLQVTVQRQGQQVRLGQLRIQSQRQVQTVQPDQMQRVCRQTLQGLTVQQVVMPWRQAG